MNNKSKLHRQFHAKVLDFDKYLKTFNVDDKIIEVYNNNNIEHKIYLIKFKVLLLEDSVKRSFTIKYFFPLSQFKSFSGFMKEEIEGYANTIDNISKCLQESKGTEKYGDRITEVQNKWNELFAITKELVVYIFNLKDTSQ